MTIGGEARIDAVDGARPSPARPVAARWQAAVPVVQLLAGRWTVPVLAALLGGGRRYQDLRRSLGGHISHKMLTETLRRAERDGLVRRHADRSRVETTTLYELTALGRSLDDPLAALRRWAEVHEPAVGAARREWDGRDMMP